MLLAAAKRLPQGRAIGVDLWQADQTDNSPQSTLANAELEGVTDRVELHTADMTALPLPDESVDVIVSNLAIHNIPTRAGRRLALDHAVRVLRPGGRLAIADLWETRQHAEAFAGTGLAKRAAPQPRMADVVRRPLVLHPFGHRHQTGVSSGPDLVVIDEQMPRAAEYLADAVRRRVLDQPRVVHAAKERLERGVDFQPGQRTAETDVNAAAPAHMLVVRRAAGRTCWGRGSAADPGWPRRT